MWVLGIKPRFSGRIANDMSEEVIISSRTVDPNSSKSQYECWAVNSGPLQGKLLLLMAKPSFQHSLDCLFSLLNCKSSLWGAGSHCVALDGMDFFM